MAAAPAKPVEIKALSGARAIGALAIVAYHFCDAHYYVPFSVVMGPLVTKAYLWVEFFFALSGFILVHVYSGRKLRYGSFLKARLARLYPVHLATLLSMVALVLVINALAAHWHFHSIFADSGARLITAEGFIASLFLVQSWGFLPGLTWNTVSWFVSVEFFLCLAFPVFLLLARGGPWRGVVLVAAGAAWLAFLDWNSGVGLDITYRNGLFRGMADFLMGAGLAMIFRALKNKPVPERVHSWIQAIVLAAVLAAFHLSGPRHSRGNIVPGLALIALILPLAFDKGFLARIFQTRLFQILGGWSYGIYMGQTLWMQTLRQVDPALVRILHANLFGVRISNITWYAEPLAVLLICILWGALLTILVERPALRFILRQQASGTRQ
jgi:peptidoglycan/LPS O-acetylase OafA/YrhL